MLSRQGWKLTISINNPSQQLIHPVMYLTEEDAAGGFANI